MHDHHAQDAIDGIIREWTQERPDLDFHYLATIGRILRISTYLREQMDSWLSPFGLTWEMFDLLASLQRSGKADGLRPTELYAACLLSSGATTNRINHTERRGLAVRRPDPHDGRATNIALTKLGHELTRKAMNAHSARAGQIADHLSPGEQAQLTTILRKLLRMLESLKVDAKARRIAAKADARLGGTAETSRRTTSPAKKRKRTRPGPRPSFRASRSQRSKK